MWPFRRKPEECPGEGCYFKRQYDTFNEAYQAARAEGAGARDLREAIDDHIEVCPAPLVLKGRAEKFDREAS